MSRESHFQDLNHHQIYNFTLFMSKKASEICDSYVIGNVNIKYTTFAREHLISNVSKKSCSQ